MIAAAVPTPLRLKLRDAWLEAEHLARTARRPHRRDAARKAALDLETIILELRDADERDAEDDAEAQAGLRRLMRVSVADLSAGATP